ncbi:MAG: UTP--glucose-1-phosphate uridylyltransferase GalU [Eubacteriaceae bacterium]|jgi:UTP--glucose-1-phosphate uridylyltransferase|nr:UTP--glucose-1-phosphate uridylyltransferase GalU [Eubacteriaceae bacterium]
MKIKKAIIPAAGLGTRFLPFTKSSPKEMLPIVDKPTIQYIVEEIVASGIEEILIITGRNKESIANFFDHNPELEYRLAETDKKEELTMIEAINNMAKVYTVRQKEALGLGHAVLCGREFVGEEPFAVVLGDDVVYNPQDPALAQLIKVYEETGTSVVGVQPVPKSEVDKYGIVAGQQLSETIMDVVDMVEKPRIEEAPSNFAILGRYILTPAIFDILEKTENGAGGEIQLTDGLKTLLSHEKVMAYAFQGRRYDVGDKQGYLEATVEFALRNPELKEEFGKYLKELATGF